jgi:pyruvate dehydrogenase (quinone)
MVKRVADLLIETLQAAGVKTCYGIVGDTMNRIAQAISRSEIDYVHMRHEEAGAFAAGAEAVLTGRLTTCAGSCGPGSLHFINGLYEANRNQAPVILMATQIVRKRRACGDAASRRRVSSRTPSRPGSRSSARRFCM